MWSEKHYCHSINLFEAETIHGTCYMVSSTILLEIELIGTIIISELLVLLYTLNFNIMGIKIRNPIDLFAELCHSACVLYTLYN